MGEALAPSAVGSEDAEDVAVVGAGSEVEDEEVSVDEGGLEGEGVEVAMVREVSDDVVEELLSGASPRHPSML